MPRSVVRRKIFPDSEFLIDAGQIHHQSLHHDAMTLGKADHAGLDIRVGVDDSASDGGWC